MGLLTIKELLETGVHFGHRVRKWNPKMEPYIYTERKGIHIIDLERTIDLFTEAYHHVRDQVAQGKQVLFVGTKRQVQRTIEEEAQRCGAHYVNRRWLGGTLTNFGVIKQRIDYMKELEEHERKGDLDRMPNKEAMKLHKEINKLRRNLEGLRDMTRLPDIMFVVDTEIEVNAIHEARRLGIPVVAVIDTNCDPDPIDFPIPGNDDAIKATKLIISRIADAVMEGKEGLQEAPSPTPEPEEAAATADGAASEPEAPSEAEAESEAEAASEAESETAAATEAAESPDETSDDAATESTEEPTAEQPDEPGEADEAEAGAAEEDEDADEADAEEETAEAVVATVGADNEEDDHTDYDEGEEGDRT